MNSTFIFSAVLVLLSCCAQAGLIRIDGFDDRPLGALFGDPDWFATPETASIVEDPADSDNQVLAVRTNSGIMRRPLAIPDGKAQMLFFRLRFGDQQNFSIGVSPLVHPSEFSDFGPELGMANQRSDLRVWEGDLSKYISLTSLNPETWYNIWVYIDNENDYFEIWVNESDRESAQPGDRLTNSGAHTFGFRSSGTADLRTFYVRTGGGQTGMGAPDGPIYLDDFYLENGNGLRNLQNPTTLGPLRITGVEKVGSPTLLQWEPPTSSVNVEHSTDLMTWSKVAGPVARGNWSSGELPVSDSLGFFRLVTIEQLEP